MTIAATFASLREHNRGHYAVQNTAEFRRVRDLSRRPCIASADLAGLLTNAVKTPHGEMVLRDIQAFAVAEFLDHGGLFGSIGVGYGKTLILLLCAALSGAKRPLAIVPPQLKPQFIGVDIPRYGKHFKLLSERLNIITYSALSSPTSSELLDRLLPDLILADEAHSLKRASSARTKRFLRYFREHPDTKFVGLSGTMTQKSLLDFYNLLRLALPSGCPLPHRYSELQDWNSVLGVKRGDDHRVVDPGVLYDFCEANEEPRQGYRRRLVETPGVVATSEDALGVSLILAAREIVLPAEIADALDKLRKTWVTPWGEEVEDAVALWRHARQLACGFFYRWVWPDGKKDFEWLRARAGWHRALRDIIKRGRRNLDSPANAARAIIAGDIECPDYWPWVAVRDRYKPAPPTEAVWVSDYLIDDAAKWLENNEGIAWYEHAAVGARLGNKTGLRVYGAGPLASREILSATGAIIASIPAHHTGKNLQRWAKSLVLCPPTSGVVWEQLLARTHRPGQEADEVVCDFYLHTPELRDGLAKAFAQAQYIERTQGQQQKLNYASKAMKDIAGIVPR